MSGRRSHVRYAVVPPPEGVLRVMQDVSVLDINSREAVAISRQPGVVGEAVRIDFQKNGTVIGVPARVVESQPIVVQNAVRHRLRLDLTAERGVPDARP